MKLWTYNKKKGHPGLKLHRQQELEIMILFYDHQKNIRKNVTINGLGKMKWPAGTAVPLEIKPYNEYF